jgi:putative transposase
MLNISPQLLPHFKGFCSSPSVIMVFVYMKCRFSLSFRKAFKENGRPDKVTVDKSGSNKAALNYFNKDVSKEEEIEIRQVKYLNNIIEQDHRFIKKRTRPTLGFKNFYAAKETISGIENIRMIQKGQILGQSACQSSFNNFANLMA